MTKTNQIADHHEIQDLETLRVLADPLRVNILEFLIADPLPVKQIAARLGLAASKLYYHVKQLEEHGLIQVVDTQIVSGIVEKTYRAVARDFKVKHALLQSSSPEGRESISTAFTSVIDTTREDLLRSLEARALEVERGAPPHPRKVLVTRQRKRLSEADAREFGERLEALASEFDEAPEAEADAQAFALLLTYYPSFYYPEDESENDA